ncbi:MAG: aminotransferase class V-fold PLP-dependent enzyme, partial [Rhodobacteraceae bacterium]|nr:aminotransferase class V-fold PLP-dependent enzyme [Paracoccaceae bacterium]
MSKKRVYLDWNATAPLRPEARAAMLEAMDAVGNPSSVHAEGRAAKAIVETARVQVAALVGCDRDQVVFTSGATEAAALAAAQKHRHGGVFLATATEHDCLLAWSDLPEGLPVDRDGRPAKGAFGSAIAAA